MHAIAIRNQIEYLALARRQQRSAENPAFKEGIQPKAKTIRQKAQELREPA